MTIAGRDDPVVAALLRAAAVAGERFSLTVMARVLDVDPRDCLAAVDRAVRAGVLVAAPDAGEGWFADEDARRVIEGQLALADRADLHSRIAEALEAEPTSEIGQIARHLSAAVATALDPMVRARLQIRLADRAVRDGDLVTAHAAARAGVAAARRSGSTTLLADAASTLEPVGDSAWDGDVYQWCSEALDAPTLDEATRVRLLARKSQAAAYCGRSHEALAASADALGRADRLGDTDLVIEALMARQLATSVPDDVEELDRLAGRMVDLGTSTGRAEVEMWGRLWRIDALWFVGDLRAIEAETSRLASCVGRVDGPYARWHLLLTRAALALVRAEFEPAARLEDEAVELFGRIGHPAVHGASVAFRLWRGHHRGHDDQRCGAPQGWEIPRMGLLPVWAIAARMAAALGADDDVRYLRGRLEPYRGRYVVGGAGGTNCMGPVELTLGACSSALGDWGAALEDLRRAGTLCRDVGAPGLRVEAGCLLAEALDRSGDPVAATTVARQAVPLARTLTMWPWLRRLEQVAGPDDPLSPRERQIAALVADGLSNREIAARLVISERTAQNHVQHILGKLRFANRAQIAAWSARTRLR